MPHAEANIGLVGHVDHGKTTLTKALSGVWTDRHSEEIKRGISIRLGYADTSIYKCEKCQGFDAYTTQEKCPKCGGPAKFLRKISFVDAPGHETLIATMLSGSALMDGVILVIAADEPCPQPQTKEHLLALRILGLKNIIVVQNKVDAVDAEVAKKNKEDIEAFLKKMDIKAPVIPIAANSDANIDVLIAAIEQIVPTPKRDQTKTAKMFVARSFDVNKPGATVANLKGGVVGGSLMQGELKKGDEIEIKPGVKRIRQNQEFWEAVKTKIVEIDEGKEKFDSVGPGGLIALQTTLDPHLTKSDALSGNVVGKIGTLPEPLKTIDCTIHLIERELIDSDIDIKPSEPLMLSIGTTVTVGQIQKQKGDQYTMSLRIPIVGQKGDRFAISKRIEMKWRLVGYGEIL
jgi:translation initiation factor 2 subunit 3